MDNDEILKMRAALDQLTATCGELIEPLHDFFQKCLDAGFKRDEALTLTRDILTKWTGIK